MPVIKLNVDGVDYTVTPTPSGPTGPTGSTGPTGPTAVPTGPTGPTAAPGGTAYGPTSNPPGAPVIPASAQYFDMLNSKAWSGNHDKGTPGDASGTFAFGVKSPDGKSCLQFKFKTVDGGGMIYHGVAVPKGQAHNFNCFAYKKRERKVDPNGWGALNQIETDLEITDTTGKPYDLAMQQSASSGSEELSINHKWTPQGVKVNPKNRANDQWHTSTEYWKFDYVTKQMTCRGVELDGVFNPINKTVTDPDNSVWGADMVNMQTQFNGGKGTVDHEILLDVIGVAAWKE